LHEHLASCRSAPPARDRRAIDKDAELHPLVRWQFVAGWTRRSRKAFLFYDIVDGRGRKYTSRWFGAIAANPPSTRGMGGAALLDPGQMDRADGIPSAARGAEGACTRSCTSGKDLQGEGKGLDRLPIRFDTGLRLGATLTATNVITVDPETGVQNMGTYRAGAERHPHRLVVRMATRVGGAGGYCTTSSIKARQEDHGRARSCSAARPTSPHGAAEAADRVDEFDVAGGLAGAPIKRGEGEDRRPARARGAEVVIEA